LASSDKENPTIFFFCDLVWPVLYETFIDWGLTTFRFFYVRKISRIKCSIKHRTFTQTSSRYIQLYIKTTTDIYKFTWKIYKTSVQPLQQY
jgi:hypothetical protein